MKQVALGGFWKNTEMYPGPLRQLGWSSLKHQLGAFTYYLIYFFFYQGFITDTNDSQDRKGREGTIFYSNLPLPPVHEHWDIYLQLCMWDDYHVFLIATLVFTRLLLDEIYHLIELLFEWLTDDSMFACLMMNWY